MKEKYFTKESITEISLSILKRMNVKNRQVKNIKNTALLVLDMQEYFLKKESHAFIPSSEAIIDNINRLIKAFSSHNLPVIYTMHIDTENNTGLMKGRWGNSLTADNSLSILSSDVIQERAKVIIKNQYDAFYKTELEEYLINKSIKQLIVCGVMTHLCCEHTARSAFVRGFEVIFPVDATATHNLMYHYSSLAALSHGYANVVLSRKILEQLN